MLNHQVEEVVVMTVALYRNHNMRMRFMVLVAVPIDVSALVDSSMSLLTFTIQVAVDLIPLVLEAQSLAIIAPICSAACFAIEMTLNLIASGIQMSFDTLAL